MTLEEMFVQLYFREFLLALVYLFISPENPWKYFLLEQKEELKGETCISLLKGGSGNSYGRGTFSVFFVTSEAGTANVLYV